MKLFHCLKMTPAKLIARQLLETELALLDAWKEKDEIDNKVKTLMTRRNRLKAFSRKPSHE